MKRIVIIGGGFAGVYAAQQLERKLRRREDVEILLFCRENYTVFQPMLAEVISGTIGLTDVVSPLRRMLKRTRVHVREVESIDVANKTVSIAAGFRPHNHVERYDHLMIAPGDRDRLSRAARPARARAAVQEPGRRAGAAQSGHPSARGGRRRERRARVAPAAPDVCGRGRWLLGRRGGRRAERLRSPRRKALSPDRPQRDSRRAGPRAGPHPARDETEAGDLRSEDPAQARRRVDAQLPAAGGDRRVGGAGRTGRHAVTSRPRRWSRPSRPRRTRSSTPWICRRPRTGGSWSTARCA